MNEPLDELLSRVRADEPSAELKGRVLNACRPGPSRFTLGAVAAALVLIAVNVSIEARYAGIADPVRRAQRARVVQSPRLVLSAVRNEAIHDEEERS